LEKVKVMESGIGTTPFGRRSMTLAMLSAQLDAAKIDSQKTIDKWKLFRTIYEARGPLGVSDRALAVLNALLSFYPKSELSEEAGIVVFPSNIQLSIRTHGMAATTLRRHLAALVEAGLILRKDSPNGKRYARRGRSGDMRDAFGFSLAPLLARSEEIERLAAECIAARQQLKWLKEQVSLCRRDVTKLIETAMEIEAVGDWSGIRRAFDDILLSLPRSPDNHELQHALSNLGRLRDQIVNVLETLTKTKKESANERQNGGHIQNSDNNSKLESEDDAEPATKISVPPVPSAVKPQQQMNITLAAVLQACPEIAMYGPGGSIASWTELLRATSVVKTMFAISQDAYDDACSAMGPQATAVVLACLLEKAGQINSPGGYLRDLTRRARRKEFSPAPMLAALMRSKAPQTGKDDRQDHQSMPVRSSLTEGRASAYSPLSGSQGGPKLYPFRSDQHM
jgi:replication initiation protein RepC